MSSEVTTPVIRPKNYSVLLSKAKQLKITLTNASAVMPVNGENPETVRAWKYACGKNYKRLSDLVEAREKEEQARFYQPDPEVTDYEIELAVLAKQHADPTQILKPPEELKPGEKQEIRIDPAQLREYNEKKKLLDARFDQLFIRMKKVAEEMNEFYARPIEFEIFYFLHGMDNAPWEANGVHWVELDWMILEQGQEIAK